MGWKLAASRKLYEQRGWKDVIKETEGKGIRERKKDAKKKENEK
jgi:hypothetical protein